MMLPRGDAAGRWRRRLGLVAVKTVHTIAFFSIGSCLGYLAYSGLMLAVGDVIADGPDYRSYWRVLAVAPQQAIVYHSVRHPWRPYPFDPSDPAAVGRVEAELIAGGVYLDCTWTFVLRPVGTERTRLLIRTRGNYAPWLLGWVLPAWGLYDASYGVAQLRAIARRAEALTTTHATAGRLSTPSTGH
jgi:hypothetical protein